MAQAILLFIFTTLFAVTLAGTADEVRTITGVNNNLGDTDLGSNDQPLLRLGGHSYEADGFTPIQGLPSARAISNAMATDPPASRSIPNPRAVSDILTYWGQWIDHDIDHSPTDGCDEPFNIAVPSGDPDYDAVGAGDVEIAFCRTFLAGLFSGDSSSPREIPNRITAWIDASGIYGNTAAEEAALRTFSGGRMKTTTFSTGVLGPINNDGSGNILVAQGNNAQRVANTELFAWGDARGNENAFLQSLHALWVREHNRIADSLDDEDLDDEDKFQIARRWVGALNQVITYREYLPTLFGRDPIPDASGYDSSVNPNIDAFFSTASFRYGHSEINDLFFRFDEDWTEQDDVGHLPLRNSYFFPQSVIEGGIESMFRGGVVHQQQAVDPFVVDAVRNQLFGFTTDQTHTAPALDLLSLNIQRGRDNGVPSYNTMRAHFGLSQRTNFNFISDVAVRNAVADVYGNDPDLIDPIVGGLLEDPVSGSNLGPLFEASLIDQFTRIRDGDRFFYLWDDFFDDEDRDELESTTLADVMKRNANVEGELDDLPDDVFVRLDIIDIQDNCEITFFSGAETQSSFLTEVIDAYLE